MSEREICPNYGPARWIIEGEVAERVQANLPNPVMGEMRHCLLKRMSAIGDDVNVRYTHTISI